MTRWQERPGPMAIAGFVVGAAAAVVVVLIVLLARGGDGDGQQAPATSTAVTTPALSTPPGPTATITRAGDPDEALEVYIRATYGAEHIGACPQEVDRSAPGVCSEELYRTEALVTFLVGAPFGEFFGEAVITPDEDGLWSVDFIAAPPLGQPLSVGGEAVVYGAGSCLNFRDAPSLSAERLSCRFDGARGEVVEGPVQADGITWWRLEELGWATGEFLAPVAD